MNYAERELLKAIARAVALLVVKVNTGGGYHAIQIREKLMNLESREESER